MKVINIKTAPAYNVYVDGGMIDSLGEYVAKSGNYKKVALITDDNVAEIYLTRAESSLSDKGFDCRSFVFNHGEDDKSLDTVAKIYDFLAVFELTRSDLLVALGGGIVGDVTGFVAATYLRGVDFCQVPTTLLAMIDSSVGGKTGVNIDAGKNQVGAFYQPRFVLCDTDTLSTLPYDSLKDGIGECVKYAVLEDKGLFDDILCDDIAERYDDIIAKCVEIKEKYVAADTFDKGVRQKLNLGHTLGHVIEKDSKYAVSHGKAVIMGLNAILSALPSTPELENISNKVFEVCEKFSIDTHYTEDAEYLWAKAGNDKKRSGDEITIVRPYAIGDCRLEKRKVVLPLAFTPELMTQKFQVRVYPSELNGKVKAPPSKSYAHRLLIVAGLSGQSVVVENVAYSADILATIDTLKTLGVDIAIVGDTVKVSGCNLVKSANIDAKESGSVLRFFLPICAMLGIDAEFKGSGRLGERPYTSLIDAFEGKGVEFDRQSGLPLRINGIYESDEVSISGNVSSQFISGLMMGAFAAKKDMTIHLTTPLESSSYVDMTVKTLELFGMQVIRSDSDYILKYDQINNIERVLVEGDYSNGAFFLVGGADVDFDAFESVQGDRAIVDLYEKSKKSNFLSIDVSEIPDLAPILCVMFTSMYDGGELINAERLKIKESDRLSATYSNLTRAGIKCELGEDSIRVYGGVADKEAVLDGANDHRIVMAAAILALSAKKPLIITDAQAVGKTYPDFWEKYCALGGKIDVIRNR